MALTEVRLRPTTPWRVGHGGGDRERVDVVYQSDALYSAITHAMKTLGWLEEWLGVTVQNGAEPAVRFSSLYPFIGRTRLIAPPKTWWPPANPGRLFTEAAKLIPLETIRNGIVDESRWLIDGETGCMFHTGSGAPVKIQVRTAAAIDRLTGVADPHRIACLEFAPNAGYWGVFTASDALWESRVKAAFRLLADSGFGGERSRGWGRAATPEFHDASSLLPSGAADGGEWWLLSVYSPHADDAVDWTRGEYTAVQRGGWTDSQAGVAPKKPARVIEAGSVLFAPSLRGRAVDVAPEGFAHPVYRAGFALAVPVPAEPVMRQPAPKGEASAETGVEPVIETIAEPISETIPEAMPETVGESSAEPIFEAADATGPLEDGETLPPPASAEGPVASDIASGEAPSKPEGGAEAETPDGEPHGSDEELLP
jgi:CRISPR type III-A-associated RAMP protein Csm4